MYKRKTYIINKEFQYGLIATFLMIVVCSLLLFSAGFALYYMVTGLVGENVYDEFIEITRQAVIRVQPVRDGDILKPIQLAEKLKSSQDPVSAFIRENIPVRAILNADYSSPAVDQYEVQKELSQALNFFLQNMIRRPERFYTEARFQNVSLSQDLKELAPGKVNPQSAEMYTLNLRLLAAAYPDELSITMVSDPGGALVDFEFQKSSPGLKRYELILPPLIINNLLLMVIIVIVGIFYSHRIAGPIFRLEQDIIRALSGERNVVVRLRKKDKLKPLAEQINKLIHELEKIRG